MALNGSEAIIVCGLTAPPACVPYTSGLLLTLAGRPKKAGCGFLGLNFKKLERGFLSHELPRMEAKHTARSFAAALEIQK